MNAVPSVEPRLVVAAGMPGDGAVIYSLACPDQGTSLPSGTETRAATPDETLGVVPTLALEPGPIDRPSAPPWTFRKFTVAADTPAPSPTISIHHQKLMVRWLEPVPARIAIRSVPASPQ